jgi:hypothetical protein
VTGTYKKYEIWRRGVVIRELEEVGCDRNLPNMKYLFQLSDDNAPSPYLVCFCPKHITLPVPTYFFQLLDDNASSPYLVSFSPKQITLPVTVYFFQLSDDNASSPYLVSSCHSLLLPTLR